MATRIAADRERRARENAIALRGRVEGLATVLARLVPKYGDDLFETHFQAVTTALETSRPEREKLERGSFERHGLNPADMRDVAKWYQVSAEEGWENDPNFGLWEMEIAEATERRCALKITRCLHAQFWRELGHAEIGYQIQCRCDFAWFDRPAWNPAVRFKCPATLMRGDDYCLLVQYLSDEG